MYIGVELYGLVVLWEVFFLSNDCKLWLNIEVLIV